MSEHSIKTRYDHKTRNMIRELRDNNGVVITSFVLGDIQGYHIFKATLATLGIAV